MAFPLNRVQQAAAGALSGTATVLSGAATAMQRVASTLRPSGEEKENGQTATSAAEIVEVFESRGRVKQPDAVPAPDSPSHVSTSATHIEELADRSASDVVDAVSTLSTDELRQLLEHEQTHKRRKTVIAAIERAGAEHAGA